MRGGKTLIETNVVAVIDAESDGANGEEEEQQQNQKASGAQRDMLHIRLLDAADGCGSQKEQEETSRLAEDRKDSQMTAMMAIGVRGGVGVWNREWQG